MANAICLLGKDFWKKKNVDILNNCSFISIYFSIVNTTNSDCVLPLQRSQLSVAYNLVAYCLSKTSKQTGFIVVP